MKEHDESTLTKMVIKHWGAHDARARHIVAVQVANGAGFGYNRILDVIVFDTWPSKGLLLHGLEIKVSEADFRKELQDTRKFADFAPHLDTFSIVAPQGIVKKELLHDRWGLYTPTSVGDKLRTAKKPLMLHDGTRKEISKSIMASFVRALVARSLSVEGQAEKYEEAFEAGVQSVKSNRLDTSFAQQDLERARKSISDFEEKSGVKITTWNGSRIGEAVKIVESKILQNRDHDIALLRKLSSKLSGLGNDLETLDKSFRVVHD